jgi:DNA-directed RNA polymerase subunit RPC12/RpoP
MSFFKKLFRLKSNKPKIIPEPVMSKEEFSKTEVVAQPHMDKEKPKGEDVEVSIAKSICPYCKRDLDKAPKRKKKCPHCGNFIYVRTSPSTRKKVLVTEEEAEKIDALRNLSQYGVTLKKFNSHKAKLSEKFGKEASTRDVIWSIYNELIAKKKDLQELKMLYYEMALFLNKEGKDSFPLLQQAAKMELMRFKKEGFIKKVRILASADSCPVCQKLNGKVFTVERALKTMPIPCKECTHKLYDGNRGFCRCSYVAEID